jgi:hypothetical protein
MLPTVRILGCRTQKRPIKNESGRTKMRTQKGKNLFGYVFTILQPKEDFLGTAKLLKKFVLTRFFNTGVFTRGLDFFLQRRNFFFKPAKKFLYNKKIEYILGIDPS